MTNPITGIDHCVILVRDLDQARGRIARLGFSVMPRGVHSEHMGTHNHCVMLRQGYFEVLAIRNPTPANERWREAVGGREGLHIIALATDDARQAHAVFNANGIASPEPLEFARPQELPGGATAEARFTVTLLPEPATPGTAMFACQHHTRDVVWHESNLDHANGAQKLVGATAIAQDPGAVAEAYGRVFGSDRVRFVDGSLVIDTGAAPIRIVTPETLADEYVGVPVDPAATAPYIAAIRIAVADRARTAEFLENGEIAHHRGATGAIYVPPSDACGALIEFA